MNEDKISSEQNYLTLDKLRVGLSQGFSEEEEEIAENTPIRPSEDSNKGAPPSRFIANRIADVLNIRKPWNIMNLNFVRLLFWMNTIILLGTRHLISDLHLSVVYITTG